MGYKVKACAICGREYQPNGPRQKFCPECRPSATAPNMNALRLAIVKQAKADGKLERMIETGAAAQLFPGTDQAYLERLAKESAVFQKKELTDEEREILKTPLGPIITEERGSNMAKHYEDCGDVWASLMAGGKVLAVDLNTELVYRLEDMKVSNIVEILGRDDVLFYQKKEAKDGDTV